jgi:hypothetical protein
VDAGMGADVRFLCAVRVKPMIVLRRSANWITAALRELFGPLLAPCLCELCRRFTEESAVWLPSWW